MERYEYLIIGAGIAGASVAYELAAVGKALIVEREPFAGYHATGRSAAIFVRPYGNATVRAITRASFGFLSDPPAGFSSHPLLSRRGCMYIAREDQADRLIERVECENRGGYDLQLLSAEQCVGRLPILKSGYLAGGFWDPTSMDIDVHELHQSFLRGAQKRGAKLVKGAEALGIEPRKDGYVVTVGTSECHAAIVINAAGAWADEVAKRAGLPALGLQPLRRSGLIVDLPSGTDSAQWPFVVDADEEFYFKSEAGKLLASPANESPSAPCDAQPEELEIAECVDRVERCTTLTISRVLRSWAGLRTFAPDRSPVVGFDPRAKRFFWLAGQGGFGVQTSPAIARLAVTLLTDMAVPEDLGALGVTAQAVSPSRLAA